MNQTDLNESKGGFWCPSFWNLEEKKNAMKLHERQYERTDDVIWLGLDSTLQPIY